MFPLIWKVNPSLDVGGLGKKPVTSARTARVMVEGVGGVRSIQGEVADPFASFEGERFVAHGVVSPSVGRSFGGEAQRSPARSRMHAGIGADS